MKTWIAAITFAASLVSPVIAGLYDTADSDLKEAAEKANEAFLTCVYARNEGQILSAVREGVYFMEMANTRIKVLERLDRLTIEGMELLIKAVKAELECAMNLNNRSINGELNDTTQRYLKEIFK